MTRALPFLLIATLMASACGDDRDTEFDDGVCDPNEPSLYIKAVTDDWYLYPEQIPDVPAPEGPGSPYLASLVENVDLAPDSPELFAEDRYSFVTSIQSFTASSTGNFVGIGIRYRLEGPEGARTLRLLDVLGSGPREDPTPAGEAGLQRADQIVAINGRSVESIISERPEGLSPLGAVSEAFGEGVEGEEVQLELEQPDGNTFSATLIRRPIEQNEVPIAQVLEVGDARLGYMLFRSFTPSSPDELASAIAFFEAEGVSQLIIDLRYNGGGRIDVAGYLANLLAGLAHDGTTFVRTQLNPARRDRESRIRFGTPECPVDACDVTPEPLTDLQEIAFITTGSTASSSEILINGLRAVMPVRIIGAPTFGKPVGFFSFTHEDCDQVYGPTSLKTVNADGDGDYFGGFEVDCAAADDLTRGFGDPEEESLAAAIALLTTGTCPSPAMGLRRVSAAGPEPRSYGVLLDRRHWQ